MIKNEKMAALFENEAFVKELKQQSSPEQVRDVFAKNGVNLSDEELADFFAEGKQIETGELGADDLDDVAGGIWGVLGGMLYGSWKWACKVYGSEEAAVEGIATFWYNVFTGKG